VEPVGKDAIRGVSDSGVDESATEKPRKPWPSVVELLRSDSRVDAATAETSMRAESSALVVRNCHPDQL
jgi:hypothetical protein